MAETMTAGTKVRGDAIRQPLNRRPRPLRLADHLYNLRQQRVGANAFRAHDESAGSIHRSRHTFAPLSFSTGMGSPLIIDSSTELWPSTTIPSTGTFSPGRTRSLSPTCT